MKKMRFLFAAFVLGFGATVANAQSEEITDENLRRYAIMMETVDVMKSEISVLTNDMIKNQEGMSGKRYLELSKGEGDAATEFEQKFMDNVSNMQDERKEAIGDVVQILATKMLPDGGKEYKAIKSALTTDDGVKSRYEAILAKIQAPAEGA